MRYRALVVAFLALFMGFLTACGQSPSDTSSLSYEEIRGTGLANSCPEITEFRRGSLTLDPSGAYKLVDLCLEPTSFAVKPEPTSKRQEAKFIDGKPLTRYTTTIDQVQGTLSVDANNGLKFVEEDGFDFQAITVLLPGGEEVPFLFTIKNLIASTQLASNIIDASTDFEGDFRVPSYRTANFLDPKGRGLAAGYDNAVALPAQADSEELLRENIKQFEVGRGHISMQVTKVDEETGELSGTFESIQPSDTDMGGKEAVDIRIRGVFYGRVEAA